MSKVRAATGNVIRRRPGPVSKKPITLSLDPRVLRYIERRALKNEQSVSGWVEEVCILALAADTRAGQDGRVVTTAAGLEAALAESVAKAKGAKS